MQADDRRRALLVIEQVVASLADLRRILVADLDDEAPQPDPLAEAEAMLRRCAEERGFRITPDGYVSEAAAAELLGRAYNTVRNWRSQHRPIPFRRFLGRIEYSLTDLAKFSAAATAFPDD